MLTPATDAFTAPVDLIEIERGQRQWSLQTELEWFCFQHRRSEVLAGLRAWLAPHDILVVDCQSFKWRKGR